MTNKKKTARKKVSKKPRTKMPEIVKESRALTIEENSIGAPPKLTEKKVTLISNAILMGAGIETAYVSAGVSKSAYYIYMNNAKNNPSEYPLCVALMEEVHKALAQADIRDLGLIDKAAQGMPYTTTITTKKMIKGEDGKPVEVTETRITTGRNFAWQAAAWKLERRNPALYGRRERLELMGEDGGPIKFSQENESEMREFLANEDNVIMLEKIADKWVEAKDRVVGEELDDVVNSNQNK